MDQPTREFAVQVLGTVAYEDGAPCIPALDPELTKLYYPGVGRNVPIMKAWVKGWTLANLAYCHCCGKGDVTLTPCPQCDVLLCQDCAPPFGGHMCEEV